MDDVKRCKKCGADKVVAEFRKRTDRGDRRNVCLGCEALGKQANYIANRDKRLRAASEYAQRHHATYMEYQRAYRHGLERPTKPRDKRKKKLPHERVNKWETREFKFARGHTRRARIAGVGGKFSAQEWQALKEKYAFTCLCCRQCEPHIKLQADHVVPIAVGGRNTIDNLQPLCGRCNRKKWKRVIDFRPAYATKETA